MPKKYIKKDPITKPNFKEIAEKINLKTSNNEGKSNFDYYFLQF